MLSDNSLSLKPKDEMEWMSFFVLEDLCVVFLSNFLASLFGFGHNPSNNVYTIDTMLKF